MTLKETQVDANFEQLEVLALRYVELRKANDTIRYFKKALADLLIDN